MSLRSGSKTLVHTVPSAGSIHQCHTSFCSWRSLMPWKSSHGAHTIHLPSNTLTSNDSTLHHFPCSKYLPRCSRLALLRMKSPPSQSPVKQLCYKASGKLQTGKARGEQEAQPPQKENHKKTACKEQQISPCSPKACQRTHLSSLHCLFTRVIAHAHKANGALHGHKYTRAKTQSNYAPSASRKRRVEVFLVFLFFFLNTRNKH